MEELMDMDAVGLVRLIGEKRISPLEVMEAGLKRIDEVAGPLQAAYAFEKMKPWNGRRPETVR